MSAIGNNSQKEGILGIFGSSVEKTTPLKPQKKNAFEDEDDEEEDDFLFSRKDPLRSNPGTKNNNSTTKTTNPSTKSQIDAIWGESDVDFLS